MTDTTRTELIGAVAGPRPGVRGCPPGRISLERSYATAHALGYHGHEFGDFHLILRP